MLDGALRGNLAVMTDPLFILAMDHRDSFAKTLFPGPPSTNRTAAIRAAKNLIFAGLRSAQTQLPYGRAGVLVDEEYGPDVIRAAAGSATFVLAVPIEASGREWFTLQYGQDWISHIEQIRPDYAKVLIHDNPAFDPAARDRQLDLLADVTERLRDIAVPLLYELLVPATPDQLAGSDVDRFDRDVRPDLVLQVIAENQARGVRPRIWKVEGLETLPAAKAVAAQASSDGSDLIVLGRDAPAARLEHWLEVASQVPEFVGFAIGRSIWEDVIRDYEASTKNDQAATEAQSRIAARYLNFVNHWSPTPPLPF